MTDYISDSMDIRSPFVASADKCEELYLKLKTSNESNEASFLNGLMGEFLSEEILREEIVLPTKSSSIGNEPHKNIIENVHKKQFSIFGSPSSYDFKKSLFNTNHQQKTSMRYGCFLLMI